MIDLWMCNYVWGNRKSGAIITEHPSLFCERFSKHGVELKGWKKLTEGGVKYFFDNYENKKSMVAGEYSNDIEELYEFWKLSLK